MGVVVAGRLVVFADYVCPYCFLGHCELERVQGVLPPVEVAAFELRPAGTPLLDPDEPWLVNAWQRSIEPLARLLDVEMRRPTIMTRTRKAHEAAAFARGHDAAAALTSVIYRAYWQEGADIGRIDVLVELGARVGLDRTALKIALDVDQCTARVAQDEAEARRLRLRGVPAYVLHDAAAAMQVRTGVQRRDELLAWMTHSNDV